MAQSGQSTAARRLEAYAENADSSRASVSFGENEAVRRALAQRHVVTNPPPRDMFAANTLDSPLLSPNSAVVGPVVSFPPTAKPAPRRATLHALQEWEGHVVDIGDDEFVARLVDLTAGRTHESEEAIIPMAEISERDASGMIVGSIFRWVIGYERSPEGTRKRVSQIVFRDLPRVTESDLRQGDEWARKIAATLSP